MTNYFGFAVADSMFSDNASIRKQSLDLDDQTIKLIEAAVPCINSSHKDTIDALTTRFGIKVNIPEKPPMVSLSPGDAIIVMSVRGLPRLTDNRHYTAEEIAGATFKFSRYEVVS